MDTASTDLGTKIAFDFLKINIEKIWKNYNLGKEEEYFELGKTVVEAAGNEEVRQIFTDLIYGRLRSEHSELLDAFNAHPKMTYWIIRQRLMTPEEKAELPAELSAGSRNHSQRRKSRVAH